MATTLTARGQTVAVTDVPEPVTVNGSGRYVIFNHGTDDVAISRTAITGTGEGILVPAGTGYEWPQPLSDETVITVVAASATGANVWFERVSA